MVRTTKEYVQKMSEIYHFNPELISRLCFFFGYYHTSEIIQAIKNYTTTHPVRVNTLLTTPKKLLKAFLEKEIPAAQHPKIEEALLIKVEGPKELEKREKEIIAYKTAAEGVLKGANLAAAGVQEAPDIKVGDEVSIVAKMGAVVGNGIAMMSSSEIKQNRTGIAVKVTESKYFLPNLQNLKEYLRGHFISQSLPSMLVGAQVTLKQKDRLLDMYVGSGEQLTHIYQRNNDKNARIIALDRKTSKLRKFDGTLKRLKMIKAPIEKMTFDAIKLQKKFSRDETFDWIIINAPCSNLGLRPKAFDGTTERMIISSARYQRKAIKQAVRLIKPGGTIIYSTCSLDPAENEHIIKFAVEELKLSVVKQDLFLGDKGLPSFQGSDLVQRFYPEKHDTPGFFIARLTK